MARENNRPEPAMVLAYRDHPAVDETAQSNFDACMVADALRPGGQAAGV